MKLIVAYLTTAAVFLALDLLWIGYIGSDFYRSQLGPLMAESINMPAAVAFYVLYIAGILIFAITPALDGGGVSRALLLGALFGFFAYATYDLTNLATLANFPLKLALVDLAWGTILTGLAAAAGCAAAQLV